MKIQFDKVGHTSKPFSLENKGVRLEGVLEKKSHHLVELKAILNGAIELQCDRCGISYRQDINEDLVLRLRDEISQDKDDLDIIEFLDGMIDITYILESEVNTLAEDYHYCENCVSDDTSLEIEY